MSDCRALRGRRTLHHVDAKKMLLAAIALPPALILLVVLLIAAGLDGLAGTDSADGGGIAVDCGTPAAPRTAGGYPLGADQVRNAQIIDGVAADRALPARAAVVAIDTAMTETDLRNLSYGDLDSLGLFQQRPSMGWGTPAQIMDPVHATGTFLDHLLRVPRWQTLGVAEAAQAVQASGRPDRYRLYEALGQDLVSVFGSCAVAVAGVPGAVHLDPARYPWPDDQNSCDDDGHGYCAGECVSFAAWAVRTAGLAHSSPDHLGNADTWTAATISSTPRPGDVAQWDDDHDSAGPMGHVAFVAAVRTDGEVLIWEYNWGAFHRFHTRWIDPGEPSRYLRF